MIQSTEKCRYKVENDSGGGKIKENGCSLCSEEYHPAVKIDFEQIIVMSAKYRVLWKCIIDVSEI